MVKINGYWKWKWSHPKSSNTNTTWSYPSTKGNNLCLSVCSKRPWVALCSGQCLKSPCVFTDMDQALKGKCSLWPTNHKPVLHLSWDSSSKLVLTWMILHCLTRFVLTVLWELVNAVCSLCTQSWKWESALPTGSIRQEKPSWFLL